MSYSAYYRSIPFSFPAGFAALAGGLAYLNLFKVPVPPGMKEVSMGEYNATPTGYLQHPERHPTRLPKVPHMRDVAEHPHTVVIKPAAPHHH